MSMQSEGGKARAKSLSPERRSELASIAANARWAGVPKESRTIPCSSQISPICLKEVVLVVANEAQANRTILKLNWNILHDHERIYGYVCPQCVKAHALGFLDRHGLVIAEAIKPPPINHLKHCRVGMRWFALSWKWPFIKTGVHGGLCCCDINRILDAHAKGRVVGTFDVWVGGRFVQCQIVPRSKVQ
jgi:hypothetical protein